MKQLTVGSLFSGIGGLDLGLERAGMRVIWQSEIDDYACRVLRKHWPDTPNLGNIKEVDWNNVERPDVICGGYPCQPFSLAGQRKGEEDERHLWPFVRDAISVLRPRYAILENVRGHLSLGGLSVVGDLASIGYDAEWRIVSAASVGANHRRDRIIIVAYPNSDGLQDKCKPIRNESAQSKVGGNGADVAYPSGKSCNGINDYPRDRSQSETDAQLGDSRWATNVAHDERIRYGQHGITATDPKECGRRVFNGGRETGYDGWQWWETEPNVGRVADGVPCRVDRLRGLGNAVVPQVAEVIGRLVVAHWAREGSD